ncbi:hypothetical protein L6452_28214 [Arctium lappa]|uniref:Uncharacterized protein n=1 Tax=Arctium lappa TaxID=4217 RepID=A0ACB8ZYU3_ARCLA|nr:hypothetical protein L6452_28214 [Arctium lappa]
MITDAEKSDESLARSKSIHQPKHRLFRQLILRRRRFISSFLRSEEEITLRLLFVLQPYLVGGSNVGGGSNIGGAPDVYAEQNQTSYMPQFPEQNQTSYMPQSPEQSQTSYRPQFDSAYLHEHGYGMSDYNPDVVLETEEELVDERADEEDEADEEFDQDPDESHVYDLGLSDVHTDEDEEEEEETSEPSPVKSYDGINDFFGMPPPFQKTESPSSHQRKHPYIIPVVEE